jgi:hypothetical protein
MRLLGDTIINPYDVRPKKGHRRKRILNPITVRWVPQKCVLMPRVEAQKVAATVVTQDYHFCERRGKPILLFQKAVESHYLSLTRCAVRVKKFAVSGTRKSVVFCILRTDIDRQNATKLCFKSSYLVWSETSHDSVA